jgi:hypothetical protein
MAISLTAYTILSTTLTGALAIAAFSRATDKPHFKEIDVERINVVETDGRLRMTISNAERSPGWMHRGKLIPGRPKSAGMIFFNDEGEENGGLTFGGKKSGDSVSSFGHLSFDQYENDQNMVLEYGEENGRRDEGLAFNDRADASMWDLVEKYQAVKAMPAGPAKDSAAAVIKRAFGFAQRVYVGRRMDKTAVVELSDGTNHPRLRLSVDSAGAANIEFLDAAGKVTKRVSGTE